MGQGVKRVDRVEQAPLGLGGTPSAYASDRLVSACPDETTAAARYAAVVAALRRGAGVCVRERPGFGSGGLMVHEKLFATLRGSTLLLKLPAVRVAALVTSDKGQAFDAGKGKPMREWVTIPVSESVSWIDLAKEALRFVEGNTPSKKGRSRR